MEIERRLREAELPIFFRRKLIFREATRGDEGRSGLEKRANSYCSRNSKSGNTGTTASGNAPVVHLGWKDVRKIGPGLSNLGNTCFLNSVLQCLTYCPSLANYMLSRAHTKRCRPSAFCLACEFESHVVQCLANAERKAVVSPNRIAANLKAIAKHFRFGRQEDAHEFMRFVVEGLHKGTALGSRSIIESIFQGTLRSVVVCLGCGNKSTTIDPFLDLCLDLKRCDNVADALRHFVATERLAGSNPYRCDKCKKMVNAEKATAFERMPPVLCIQLKRFSYSSYGDSIKIGRHIAFEESLRAAGAHYGLFAVLVHAGGSCNMGHYYAFVKGSNGLWYCMNDSAVRQVSLSTVLSQSAYILFYERVDLKSGDAETKTDNFKNPEAKQTLAKSAEAKQTLAKNAEVKQTLAKSAEVKQTLAKSAEAKPTEVKSLKNAEGPADPKACMKLDGSSKNTYSAESHNLEKKTERPINDRVQSVEGKETRSVPSSFEAPSYTSEKGGRDSPLPAPKPQTAKESGGRPQSVPPRRIAPSPLIERPVSTGTWTVSPISSIPFAPAALRTSFSFESLNLGANPLKRRIDAYDEEYDSGRQKKVKAKLETINPVNSFQRFQDRENRFGRRQ